MDMRKTGLFLIIIIGAALVVSYVGTESASDITGKQIAQSILPPLQTKLVFVTQNRYHPGTDFWSFWGADIKCRQSAQAAGLNGTFVAWLSANETNVSGSWVVHARDRVVNAQYFRVDGVRVANGLFDLTDGAIDTAIKVNEFGNIVVNNTQVWTGTDRYGYATDLDCNEWSTSTGNDTATIGSNVRRNYAWTEARVTGCARARRLYCFEV